MMKRLALGLASACLAATCSAHPLGNFSVNRVSDVRVDSAAVRVTYMVDLAEIPSFQDLRGLDADDDGSVSPRERALYARTMSATLAHRLHVRVDGQERILRVAHATLEQRDGQGGLPCTRVVAHCDAPLAEGTHRVVYRDDNYSDRIGWVDVVVRASDGARLLASDASPRDVTRGLTTYPEDVLTSPSSRTQTSFTVRVPAAAHVPAHPAPVVTASPVAPAAPARTQELAPTPPPPIVAKDRFVALIAQRTLTLPVALVSLFVALVLGMIHALSPGHGKTIVGAYLVGTRGTATHALFLGLVVTLTHTIGVYALGLITLFASRYIVPERLYPWLGFASGVMVALIGGMLFHERIERLIGRTSAHRHLFFRHTHAAGDDSHLPTDASGAVTWRSLLGLGVSGGLVPCPSAIVVLLSAIALHRVGFGLLLIVAFSIGLAAVLVALGLLAVYGAQYLRRFGDGGWVMRLAPAGSAVVVAALGLAIAVQSLVTGGILRLSL